MKTKVMFDSCREELALPFDKSYSLSAAENKKTDYIRKLGKVYIYGLEWKTPLHSALR